VSLASRALLLTLREEAEKRQDPPAHLHIAERCDPKLACLMRRVADAQRALDAYVIAQTSPAERSK